VRKAGVWVGRRGVGDRGIGEEGIEVDVAAGAQAALRKISVADQIQCFFMLTIL
jgi:hypothetical protein